MATRAVSEGSRAGAQFQSADVVASASHDSDRQLQSVRRGDHPNTVVNPPIQNQSASVIQADSNANSTMNGITSTDNSNYYLSATAVHDNVNHNDSRVNDSIGIVNSVNAPTRSSANVSQLRALLWKTQLYQNRFRTRTFVEFCSAPLLSLVS
jgi:hypothetical protein